MDIFQNDEAIAKFIGLRKGILSGDHMAIFSTNLDCAAYFGEIALSSSCKMKSKNKTKNDTSLGENRKAPFDDKK